MFFLGINYGSDNDAVAAFDEEFGITLPTVSGLQGSGNGVFELYQIASFPTVIVITPNHQIVEQYIYPPSADNIIDAVEAAGGILVSVPEKKQDISNLTVYPNPITNNGYLSFSTLKNVTFSYSIYDLTGKELFRSAMRQLPEGQQRFKLPVEDLNNGMYFVQLKINEKVPETIRFIIAK